MSTDKTDRRWRLLLGASYGFMLVSALLAWLAFRDRSGLEAMQGPEDERRAERATGPKRSAPRDAPRPRDEVGGSPKESAAKEPDEDSPRVRARLEVVAAESGLELTDCRLVEFERPALARADHPGVFGGCRELGRGDSPLAVTGRYDLWDRLALLAPGRAALFFSIDARTDGDRRLELEPGTGLQVILEGFRPDDFAGERTRIVLRRRGPEGEILVDRPADLGEGFQLEHLPTGPAVLTIEAYPIGHRPPLARQLLDLRPGGRPGVLLARLPDPPRIPVAGSLLLPEALAACDWLQVAARQLGAEAFEVELIAQREKQDPSGTLRFAATLPAVGDWELAVEGQRFPFAVGGAGRDDLRFELAAPAPLTLAFAEGDVRRAIVRWRAGAAAGLGFLVADETRIMINPPPGPVELEIELDAGIQVEELEIPPGGGERTILIRPPISLWIGATFANRHVQLDMEDLLVVAREDGGAARHRFLLGDPFRCRLGLAEPGRYRLSLRRAPPGYLLPAPLEVDLEPGAQPKLAFVLEKRP